MKFGGYALLFAHRLANAPLLHRGTHGPRAFLRGLSLHNVSGEDDVDKRAEAAFASAAWAAVLGDMKMEEAFEKWHSEETHDEMRVKLRQIGAYWPNILRVMNRGQTIEKVLHQKQIIVLSSHADKDIEMMNERIVGIDASSNELVGWNQASGFGKILYIVGPRGKGKRFIGCSSREDWQGSLRHTKDWLKEWERKENEMHTTVYVNTNLMRYNGCWYWNWRDADAGTVMFGLIQDSLHELYPILYNKDTRLDLHLTVVLDGAFGRWDVSFENERDGANQLYGRLKGIVLPWKQTRVIVLGTEDL
jgi:hypothetical protein